MSVRTYLQQKFAEDWQNIPDLAGVHVVASQEEVDVVSVVFAIISQQSIGPNAAAPLSHRDMGLTVTLVSPLGDLDAGTDELEPILPTLLDYLDENVRSRKPTATFGLYGTHAGYSIPITVIASKDS